MVMKNTIVQVELAGRSYPIEIGSGVIKQLGERLAALGIRQAAIISDDTVAPLYGNAVESSLRAYNIIHKGMITVAAGESSKDFATLQHATESLLAKQIDRQTAIIALGGGVIGDLAGFIASITLRGLPFVQIPTTLLAQVDSSVGGKTGINTPQGKNLVGAFYQPKFVLIDTDMLATLPPRQLRAGYAEIVKYGLINNAEFFKWCEENGQKLLAGDKAAQQYAIELSCRSKAAIVSADEFETTGQRALLNLGHTFGHAYEALCGYSDTLLHGEAVSLGLVQAARLSCELGLCDESVPLRIHAHLAAAGMPTDPRAYGVFTADDVLATMQRDKKTTNGQLNFVLLSAIGQAKLVKNIPADKIRALIH